MVIGLAILIGLSLVAGLVVRLAGPDPNAPPEKLDRAALRAEMLAKRKRGESVAVRTIADQEADERHPGVDFVAKGDSGSLLVFDVSTNRKIGTFGTAFDSTLHDDARPGDHDYRISMEQGAEHAFVHVTPNTLTRVVIELKRARSERSIATSTAYFDADVHVEDPLPAYAK